MRLAAAENGGVVKVWDLAAGRELWKTELQKGPIGLLSFSHDGKRLAAECSSRREVRILDAESGHEFSPPLNSLIPTSLNSAPMANASPRGSLMGP